MKKKRIGSKHERFYRINNRTNSSARIKNILKANRNIIEAFTYPVYAVDLIKDRIITANSAAKAANIKDGLRYSQIDHGSGISSGNSSKEFPAEEVKKIKKPFHMEYAVCDNNGNTTYKELCGYPVFDSKGDVIQTIEYIIDITERKKAQEELVKLSQAVEQSLNIVMITDYSGIIEYVNPKFTEITGFTSHEVIGKKASSLGETTPAERKRFRDILNTEGEWRGEFNNKKKNGEHYWEYASIYSIKNSRGVISHYIKDAVNISKRKQAEEELRIAKEKAEQANRFKSEFLATMSHEIRTPLNSILGFIELLLTTNLDKIQKEYFDIIKDSSKVLLGIIDDILDFSKIESGKLEIDKIKFYLKHEFEPVIDMFTARADEKDIELLYFIDPALPEFIFGDPLRIKQVLNNLISNAVKFTPEKGKIFVEIKLLELSEDLCRILFSVSDNGIGIPQEKIKDIFNAFSQADPAISRKYGGTGLGLSISSQLVKLMGGELKLESRVGTGSQFYFELGFNEYSGIDIFKRDYNFKNLICFLYIKNKDDKIQLYNIERYLKAFNIEVEIFSSTAGINISNSDNKKIMFIDYSSKSRTEIKSILQELPGIPVILIAGRSDKDFITPMVSKIIKVIYKPVYASKIIGAIIDILYNKNQTIYSAINDEKFNRVLFSAEALVAEDNVVNQRLITLMLKEIGVNADIANNGLEVVDRFKKKKYDIILMDVNMPAMDGIEATAKIIEIEKSNGLKHTPIIALTAKTIRGDRELILNSGMDDYLTKPISINKLYASINTLLKKNVTNIKDREPLSSDNNLSNNDLIQTARELGVSADFIKDLIKHFIINFENYLINILKDVKDLDFDAIYAEAHKLKGTTLNLRLKKLADYFSQLELNAKNKNEINYDQLLDLIKKEFILLKENFLNDPETE